MKFFSGLADVPETFGPSAVTIGKFDGVHAGHRAVIERLMSAALDRGLTSTVMTFDRHPLATLMPQKAPDALVSSAQKIELLADTGVDAAVMVAFDETFSALEPQQFAQTVLVDGLHAGLVLVGSDFRYGANGSGTVDLLRQFGDQHGFEVELIEDVRFDGHRRVSSTWIRELLGNGDIERATELLGHLPTIRAMVVHGLARGRGLGYPTANLDRDIEGYIPADGVYATWVIVDGVSYGAATSVGNNPTFEGIPDKTVESHLFDQSLNLYGKTVEVAFVSFVRGMRKFSGPDALAQQMGVDAAEIRRILGLPSVGARGIR